LTKSKALRKSTNTVRTEPPASRQGIQLCSSATRQCVPTILYTMYTSLQAGTQPV